MSKNQVIIRIIVVIALMEFFIMMLLSFISGSLDANTLAVLDTFLLIGTSTPLIYFLVIRPFVNARDEALEEVKKLAHFDPLTKLANRRLFYSHLEHTLAGIDRHKHYGAVLMIDLDKFKTINDTNGHDAGDAVLVEIAKRIKTITRLEDNVCRFGGDEFVILINYLGVNQDEARKRAVQVANKLLNHINKPCIYNKKTLNVEASIGIRLLDFEERMDKEAIIRDADIAMYQAKAASGNHVVLFPTAGQ